MTHPTQPVPKSAAWKQAQGTMLHLANCIVVIEIWKPSARPRFSFALYATCPFLVSLIHSLAPSVFCSFTLRISRATPGSLLALRAHYILWITDLKCDSQVHNYCEEWHFKKVAVLALTIMIPAACYRYNYNIYVAIYEGKGSFQLKKVLELLHI